MTTSPSELQRQLRQAQVAPLRRFSQNFLTDANIIRKIVTAALCCPQDHILEIGPGLGALTEQLLISAGEVIAVEKDRKLCDHLRTRFSEKNHFRLVEGDILEVSLEELITSPTKVIANLPYHLTSPILGQFLPRSDLFSELTLMVQKEVALRLVAVAHKKDQRSDFGLLSLFAAFYADVSICFYVSRNVFYPKPKVDSAIVQFKLKKTDPQIAVEPFFKMLRAAFQQRRKMIRSSLSSFYTANEIKEALGAADSDFGARPEELSLEQWKRFFLSLSL